MPGKERFTQPGWSGIFLKIGPRAYLLWENLLISFHREPPLKFPPFSKGGLGGIYNHPEIPLNPPFSKGDFEGLGIIKRSRMRTNYLKQLDPALISD